MVDEGVVQAHVVADIDELNPIPGILKAFECQVSRPEGAIELP